MIYLIAAIVGLLASVISLLLYGKIVSSSYRRRTGFTGEIGISVFSPPLLLVVIATFVAGFYAVLRISK